MPLFWLRRAHDNPALGASETPSTPRTKTAYAWRVLETPLELERGRKKSSEAERETQNPQGRGCSFPRLRARPHPALCNMPRVECSTLGCNWGFLWRGAWHQVQNLCTSRFHHYTQNNCKSPLRTKFHAGNESFALICHNRRSEFPISAQNHCRNGHSNITPSPRSLAETASGASSSFVIPEKGFWSREVRIKLQCAVNALRAQLDRGLWQADDDWQSSLSFVIGWHFVFDIPYQSHAHFGNIIST